MKSTLTFSTLLAFLFLSFTSSAQVYYVNHAATGMNTGTGWPNAFPTLNEALNSSPIPDTIKVAMGTYTPDVPNGSAGSTFLIDTDLVLLGGYNALTEERDSDLYETILSGDLNDNDEEDNFEDFKSDNVMTVVTVTATTSGTPLIDGFTIRNGYADAQGTSANSANSGAGLFSTGTPTLKNCVFEQNYAAYRGGGAHFQYFGTQLIEVENCGFTGNWALRGGGLNIRNAHCNVTDCYFENNVAPQHGGGMRYNGDGVNRNITISNCAFADNVAAFAGGLRLQATANGNNFLLENCDFISNRTAPYPDPDWGQGGGGLYLWNGSNNSIIEIDNCYFFENAAEHNGSACIFNLQGDNVDAQINNCQIIENTTNQYSAALDIWGNSGGSGKLSIDSCLFDKNSSFWSGALEMGNGWGGGAAVEFEVTNSTFTENEATEGGAIGLWSTGSSLTNTRFENCIIQGNTGTIRGGGIGLYPENDDFIVQFSRCQIVDNESPLGGAVESYMFNQDIGPLEDILIQFDNCLISGNTSPSSAAISLDSITNFSLINCTVADNSGGAIELHDQSSVILQNTILYNNGDTEIEDVTADGVIQSNGGNLIGDNSLGANAHASDQEGVPLFNASGDHCTQYQASSIDSPVVGHGLPWADQLALDLCGNPRDQGGQIDIGAFESDFLGVAVKEIFIAELSVFPNPANDYITLQFPENIATALQAQIFDSRGRLIQTESISNNQNLPVKELTAGLYTLKIKDHNQVYVGKFIKH